MSHDVQRGYGVVKLGETGSAGQQGHEYRSYLLRVWCPGEGASWRIMLEDICSGERQSFADLRDLVNHLQARVCGEGKGISIPCVTVE